MDWWEKCLGIILVYEDKNCGGSNPFRILITSGGGFLFHNIVLSATCMIVRIIHCNGAYDASTRYSECNARSPLRPYGSAEPGNSDDQLL